MRRVSADTTQGQPPLAAAGSALARGGAAAKPESAAVSGAQAVLRALSLLSSVGRGGSKGLSLSELATATTLSPPTARRLLLALTSARMVEQDPASRRYRLGPEAWLLASFAQDRHGLLHHAEDCLTRLAEESGDTALLTVQQQDHALCLMRVEGDFPIRTHALETGDRNPMGIGAGAMAILAALPSDEASPLLAALPEAIRADYSSAQHLGYAFNPGRIVPGSWGIGLAILWPDRRPAGALSLAAIDSRMGETRRAELITLLRREARVIEARLAGLTETTARRPAPS